MGQVTTLQIVYNAKFVNVVNLYQFKSNETKWNFSRTTKPKMSMIDIAINHIYMIFQVIK